MKILAASFLAGVTFCSYSWAGGCSDMAAFNSQISKFLNTASVADTLKADVKELATECQMMHDQGMSVNSISSCGDALKLTMVN